MYVKDEFVFIFVHIKIDVNYYILHIFIINGEIFQACKCGQNKEVERRDLMCNVLHGLHVWSGLL